MEQTPSSSGAQQPSNGGKKYVGMAKEASFNSQAPKPTFVHNESERTATKADGSISRPVKDAESSKLGISVKPAQGY